MLPWIRRGLVQQLVVLIGCFGFAALRCAAQAPALPLGVWADDGRAAQPAAAPGMLVLARATGDLEVLAESQNDTHEVYFHIPIATEHQAPILINVTSPELVSYRFLRLDDTNLHMAATLRSAPPEVSLDWEAYVLIANDSFADRPRDVPLPTLDQIPEGDRAWLSETACVQLDDPYIRAEAAAVREGVDTLDELAESVGRRASVSGAHVEPWSLDAYYGLRNGGSCTSHAHAAVALFRANGVPARSVGVIQSANTALMDMHWVVDYLVPGYGWVMLESTSGTHPLSSMASVVTFVSRPEDEFPLYYVYGIDVHFHDSDPLLSDSSPHWGLGHSSQWLTYFQGEAGDYDELVGIGREVFVAEADVTGMRLLPGQQAAFDAARTAQAAAVDAILADDLATAKQQLRAAREQYRRIAPRRQVMVLDEDFEHDDGGFTHGGAADEWQWGSPAGDQITAHSGVRCWATDLDGSYENNSDSWLLSPPVDLRGLAEATLSFWVLNWVEDGLHQQKVDFLWLDISTDGEHFVPLCSKMGGVTNNPEVPAVAGWTHVVLDLDNSVDAASVRFRFRFASNEDAVWPGSHIDDVQVYGRPLGTTLEPRRSAGGIAPGTP